MGAVLLSKTWYRKKVGRTHPFCPGIPDDTKSIDYGVGLLPDLVEVAYSSLDTDCKEKAPIYARANIADYWVLDVSDKEAYIYRNPTISGYQSEIILDKDTALAPLAFPEIEIPLLELFLP